MFKLPSGNTFYFNSIAGYLKLTCFFVLLFSHLVLPQEKGEISLFQKEENFVFDTLQASYTLPDSFLISGSEEIWLDSLRLSDKDYELDYITGTFFISRNFKGDSLKIFYKILPVNLRKSYKRRSPKYVTRTTVAQDSGAVRDTLSVKPVRREVLPGANLRKSGSIIRGVSVGSNQSLQVDSGLRMQVSGKLTKNVEIVASLTDQDTPIQPEGNTQSLNEIDKVFIQVKGPNLQATLGDIDLTFTQSELLNYNRKLEGIVAQGDYEKFDFKASAAVSRGQFTTNEFMGQEGNQGPYQLTGENGNINILVIAGTEKVWIDGEPMTRGENNDYIIEYGNGQITFTRNRLITADSRIVVDFQFSDESFQRNYFAVQGHTKLWNDKLQIGTTFIRESDDKNSPLGLVLSNDVLDALGSVGDSVAVVPGDTLVGEGNGAYVIDSTDVFIYVGPGAGNYNVRFSFFGAGRGDYRNIGFGRFEYVGAGNGDYQPFIILPRAKKHDTVGFNLNLTPVSSLNLSSEVVFSQFDQNLYSTLDDGDNNGNAYFVRLNLSPEKLRLRDLQLGTFVFTGNIRKKSANYRDIGRSTIAEFDRRWNLSNTNNTTAEEEVLELSGTYSPISGLSFQSGLGQLSKSSQFQSNRWDFQTTLDRGKLPKFDYFVEVIDRDDKRLNEQSNWLRHRGRSELSWKTIRPFAEYAGEVRKDTDPDSGQVGFMFDAYTGGLAFNPFKKMSLSARYTVRDDKDRVAGNFIDKSVAKTQVYNWGLQNLKGLTMTASYTHRNRNFADQTLSDTRTDLADLRVAYRPGKGWLNSNIYYQISNTQVARQEQVYIEVEEGEGNFSFNEELNEFEPDAFGNFVQRLFATNDFIPVVELRLQGDFRLKPANFFSSRKVNDSFLKKWLTPVSTQTFFRIEENSQESDVKKIYLLDFDALQNDSTTIYGSIEFRQDVHFWENKKDFSLRYRLRTRDELNNRFVDGQQDRYKLENSFRLRYQLTDKLSSQVEFENVREDRIFTSMTREDRKIRSNELELDILYRPVRKWDVGLKSGFRLSRNIIPDSETEAKIYELAPRFNYSLSTKGRLRFEFTWTKVDLAPKDRLIPFELTDGNAGGITYRWNFGFDYRVSGNIQASVTYLGRNEPDRPETQHIARAEMRAFF